MEKKKRAEAIRGKVVVEKQEVGQDGTSVWNEGDESSC
jgi:hypothetical protein